MKEIVTEIAIIGAGSAGLSAAYQAASAGADVLVIDENKLPGGQLFKQIHKFFGSKEHKAGTRGYIIGQELLEKVQNSGAKVLLDSLVYGLLPDNSMGVISGGVNYSVKAKKIIVATGAKENYMAFPGSTLPGVMGAGAAQTMANVNRVLPGKKVLMLGSGNVGLIVSYQLMQAGAEVVAIVEGGPKIGGYGVHAGKVRRAGVPIYTGHTIKRVYGEGKVEGVEIAAVDEKWNIIPGSEKNFDVDTVCLAVGLNPMTELLWMTGCEFDFIQAFGGHVPLHDENMETSKEGIYVAGDVTGVEEASSAMEEGNLAGVCAAHSLGYLTDDEKAKLVEEINERLNTLRSGYFGERRRMSKQKQIEDMKLYKESLLEKVEV
ncbi:MAG: NAD(P)/FAD-dependent oxidoreductase [Intestinibacter bartlettii]|uniref:NAD(P)/FAD-dependent oxidoreductase n=1 Tax=Intestinibacter bartlettii TaxID=261299 RepID=UPI0026EF5DC8|nr:NAD(P)/FAD-dependent oxidoreductase [Intestinibacter bartlettii]MDO5010045.1 NAD(P)/FAD-dependent oxidoreductase [Intestinibacter bartlettii]